ncbi:hypothetical protein [Methylomicrobium sp. Wu6]|uniref:hypothetical protein n=1 Tax=Methylomicrobium sp. Wu6 TaxID=3107928 RepID=UPI002DD694A8|nr:hypothetical protein [Methylomicrobium sp. Wu6]MEC4747766.1 hypothetical protein [Methylomicrobium sp. Wu6]
MKRGGIVLVLLLIALTNFVVITIDGVAPLTVFILYFPVVVYFVLIRLKNRLPVLDNPGVVILAGYLFFVSLINIGEVRWSSFWYSILFCVFFLFIAQHQYVFSRERIQKTSKIIIYSYLINVLLAQILFAFIGGLSSLEWLFQGTLDAKSGVMRFQGFSSEPSYAAFVVLVAFLVYSRFTKDTRKSKAIILLSVIFLLRSFSSVYGYIILSAIGLDWVLRHKKTTKINRIIILFIAILGGGVVGSFGISGESRVGGIIFLIASGNLNLESLRFIDGSAFMRVGPLFSYLEEIDWFSMQTYVGYGAGSAAIHFGSIFNDVIDSSYKGYESSTLNLGFFPAFSYDYGIIGVILVFLTVLRRGMCGFISIESFIIILLLFNANFNTQLFWYVWAMLFIMNNISSRTYDIEMRINSLRFTREVL